jgi:hypothetical protein
LRQAPTLDCGIMGVCMTCHRALLVQCSSLHGLVACLVMLFGAEWTQWIERGRQAARYGAFSHILSAILTG